MGRGSHINAANSNQIHCSIAQHNDNMFVKLAVLACTVALASAVYNGPLAGGLPASLYPAGVSPQACPNYPNCQNPAVAANPSAPAYAGGYAGAPYNPAPAYPAYNPAPSYPAYNNPAPAYNGYNQNALDSGEYTGDGDYHGEGLAESGAYGSTGYSAPSYNPAPAYNPAPYGQPAQVPAGVDPHSCPNYPFCH